MPDFTKYAAANLERLSQARRVAESLRHDERLHRLAMHAVFVLEDSYEALHGTGPQIQWQKPMNGVG